MALDADSTPATSSDKKTQFVLSGQPTGWAAMASVVRDFDVEKVQDCKEDMDTLLVFAGLFSAVLSAFLIAAYPALQPDPTYALLFSLDRIAAQTASYTFNGVTLNATNALPPALVFTPSQNNVRVNVLWFASLLISLITASFAILVKQWLRGFLAVENPSPQARLRIRHFRAPGMDIWKVYELAAALPLLLQLSLGLFFVGLCYFTAAINSSVHQATVPLVAGWVFCFFAVTLLPVFFPRCPYRTALLKSIVLRIYHRLGPHAQSWFSNLYRTGSSYSQKGLSSSTLLWLRTALLILIERASSNDEVVVVSDSSSDLDILSSVDVIQANDELLGTTIREALRSAQSTSLESLKFLLTVLANRVQLEVPTTVSSLRTWKPRIIDVRSLTRQGRVAVMGIASDITSQMEIPHDGRPVHSDTQRSIALVFSIIVSLAAHGPLVPELWPFVKACLEISDAQLCRSLVSAQTDVTKDRSLLRADTIILLRALTTLIPVANVDMEAWHRCFSGIIDAQLDFMGVQRNNNFALNDDGYIRQLPWPEIFNLDASPNHGMSLAIDFMLQAACSTFNRARHTGASVSENAYRAVTLALIMQSQSRWDEPLRVDMRKRLRELIHAALFDMKWTSDLMFWLVSAPDEWVSHTSRHESDHAVLQGAQIDNLALCIQAKLSEEAVPKPIEDDPLRYLFICAILADPLPAALSEQNRIKWRNIADLLTEHVVRIAESPQTKVLLHKEYFGPSMGQPSSEPRFGRLAHFCLFAIDYAEVGWGMSTDYDTYLWNFDADKVLFSDRLIEALGKLTAEYDKVNGKRDGYRLRRLLSAVNPWGSASTEYSEPSQAQEGLTEETPDAYISPDTAWPFNSSSEVLETDAADGPVWHYEPGDVEEGAAPNSIKWDSSEKQSRPSTPM